MEISMVMRPFQRIGMDVLGPFPQTKQGNKQIIVWIDYLTEYAEAVALPSAKAEDVAKVFVETIVLRHGAPETITTDRGSNFMSAMFQELTTLMETNHQKTTPYHPQSNGLVERFNHTLSDMLSMYVNKQHTDWDTFLVYLTIAYNTSRHEATGYTPFYE